MKPIILFLSAICAALLGVMAIYDDANSHIWIGAIAVLVWALAGAYIPKLRPWCGLIVVVVVLPVGFASIIHDIYTDGILSFLAGSGGAFGGGLAAYAQYKSRVEMKKSGLPEYPGDENKSDEELEAEEAAEKGWLIRHLKRFWNRGK